MKLESLSRFFLGIVLLIICAVYSIKSVGAQTTSSSVLVFPVVALSACTIPAEVTWTASGYIALCNTTTGLAQAISPSTTFSLVGGGGTAGVISFNGRTGAVVLTDADVTGTGIKIATTVTSTAVSTAQ